MLGFFKGFQSEWRKLLMKSDRTIEKTEVMGQRIDGLDKFFKQFTGKSKPTPVRKTSARKSRLLRESSDTVRSVSKNVEARDSIK